MYKKTDIEVNKYYVFYNYLINTFNRCYVFSKSKHDDYIQYNHFQIVCIDNGSVYSSHREDLRYLDDTIMYIDKKIRLINILNLNLNDDKIKKALFNQLAHKPIYIKPLSNAVYMKELFGLVWNCYDALLYDGNKCLSKLILYYLYYLEI